MASLARRAVLGTIAVAVLRAASVLGDSSCLSAKSAEDCRSQIEEGTGDQCVWCSCLAIPSECLGASLAKVWFEAENFYRPLCLSLRGQGLTVWVFCLGWVVRRHAYTTNLFYVAATCIYIQHTPAHRQAHRQRRSVRATRERSRQHAWYLGRVLRLP